MAEQEFSSRLLENAVEALSRLPGVGRKTALRLALHILRQDEAVGVGLGEAIVALRKGINYCKVCHNISEEDVCPICSSPRRDSSIICVVENVRDVLSFEKTGRFNGLYHVLGGLISPLDGVGPDQIEIASLADRVKRGTIREVILALSATMEGDTTNFYIYRQLRGLDVKLSQIARGVSEGNEIEFTDEATLGKSLLNRIPFDDSFA